MGTVTVTVTEKGTRAAQLRTEVMALGKEVSEFKGKLEPVERRLGSLETERRELAEAGKPGGDLHLKIRDAEGQADILRSRLNEKQSRLEQVTATLRELDHELGLESQRAARQVRYEALEKQLTDAAAVICEDVRRLIEENLVRFDAAKDALISEFLGGAMYAGPVGPEGQAARDLIHREMNRWNDGASLSVTRRLLRADWKVRGDIRIEITNMRPRR